MSNTTTKEEYKAKWEQEWSESEGCRVFSFDSRDLANPACGEALAEMGIAALEEQPPAKKPRGELEPGINNHSFVVLQRAPDTFTLYVEVGDLIH